MSPWSPAAAGGSAHRDGDRQLRPEQAAARLCLGLSFSLPGWEDAEGGKRRDAEQRSNAVAFAAGTSHAVQGISTLWWDGV